MNVKQDVVEHYESMLVKARCGEVQGVMEVEDLASGGQRIVTRGTFAEDPTFAIRIAIQSLDVALEKAGLKKNLGPIEMTDPVPARLRV